MTFTYAGPAADGTFGTARDEVRFLAQDTAQTTTSVSDEELAYFLGAETQNRRLAAADVLDRRAVIASATSANGSTLTVGPFSVSGTTSSSQAEVFRQLAAALRSGAGLPGGATLTITLTADGAPDGPVFGLGMNDAPGAALPPGVGVPVTRLEV